MNNKVFKEFLTEMQKLKDEHLHILRGHLLIEEKLRELITVKVKKPEALSDARLSFNQILCIAVSFYWKKNSDWLWGSIRKLNNIRNNLSHQLTLKKYEDNIKSFLDIFKNDEFVLFIEAEKFGNRTRMVIAMSIIYQHLDKFIKEPTKS